MEAFDERWFKLHERVYEDVPLHEISWFNGSVGSELGALVVDGIIKRGDRVIDLGCGPGIDTLFFATQGMVATGIDRSESALDIARRLADIFGVDASWILGDILATSLADGCADVVNDSYVFHNVRPEARPQYAKEVVRLLRPGGIFVLRGFSDQMEAGRGPYRLTSAEILDTFAPLLSCERLTRFRGLPTERRPDQLHWLSIWRR